MQVGVVDELWRYPVKSMQGELLTHAHLTADGIPGDRGVAVIDAETGHAISGKRVEALLGARAVGRPGAPAIVLPDGETVGADDPRAATALSAWLGRPVRLGWPDHGRPTIDSTEGSFEGAAGTFFDSAPLHLITSATLAHLATLYPDGDFDRRRFRANIVVRSDADGPVERDWIGRTIAVGDVPCEVVKGCGRCRMTTSAQGDLPTDRGILKTIANEQDNIAGVMLRALEPGRVAVGAAVTLT